jgi:hypothetical protein
MRRTGLSFHLRSALDAKLREKIELFDFQLEDRWPGFWMPVVNGTKDPVDRGTLFFEAPAKAGLQPKVKR